MFGVPAGELALLAAAIAGGGVLTGLLAGLFGIGGGGVIVPILYEVFRALGVSEDVRMQLCVGTSLAIIVPTTFRSYFAHRAEGIGLHDVVRIWTIPAIVGVATGAAIAAVAPGAVFKAAFAVIAGDHRDRSSCSAATAGSSATSCPAAGRCSSTAISSACARR